MHVCRLYWNGVLEVYLGTPLRDKHGHLFWLSFKVGQTKVENINFCWLCRNWVFKVDLANYLKDKHGHIFLWGLELFWPSFKVGETYVKNMHFCWLSRNCVFKWIYIPIWEISMGSYFYHICSYFGARSRLVKPRLKICTFVDFIEIEILK